MGDLLRSKSVFLVGFVAVATATIEPPANAAPLPKWAIVNLGVLPGGNTSRATAVNDQGVIAGYSNTAKGTYHAVRWNPTGGITDLGLLPGGTYSYAHGINNRGEIVGYANTANGTDRAVRWAPNGAITDLGTLPGRSGGYAAAINDTGAVVGYTPIQAGVFHAVRWKPGGPVSDLGTTSPLGSTTAAAINKSGVVAGTTFEGSQGRDYQAVTWAAGSTKLVALPPLPGGGPHSSAEGVSDKGLIVGYSQSDRNVPNIYPIHAALWARGAATPTDLGTLTGAGGQSLANGVNATGTIVGASTTSTPGDNQAVLWKQDKTGWHIAPLPQLPLGKQSEATAVNSTDGVVGEASTVTGQKFAVRWKQ
ncbi:hypothetical protein [Actinomadura sp. NEAU-AAG7]|uniref:hypothetical protein n=1 Tax=Actinomadura sp. NEAU-AAG7 TaxID=2839640 RepID=UPI001BE490C3|nr:hypothetical protein [Actinomadura sp. NEAU-AAG7]MBT2209526.1 hypothetical protein [Actinomadura sp. NEAU-AAG7]